MALSNKNEDRLIDAIIELLQAVTELIRAGVLRLPPLPPKKPGTKP